MLCRLHGRLRPLGVVFPAACPVLLCAGLPLYLFGNRFIVTAPAQSKFPGPLTSLNLRLSVRFLAFGALFPGAFILPAFRVRGSSVGGYCSRAFVLLNWLSLMGLAGFWFRFRLVFPAFVKRGRSPGFSNVGVDGVLGAGSCLPFNLGGSGARSRKVAPTARLCDLAAA